MTTIYIKEGTELPVRANHDEYVTPKNLILASIPSLVTIAPEGILDVGAGDGRWGTITRGIVGAHYMAGVEIQDKPKPEGFDNWYCPQDFLAFDHKRKYDLIVSNPPYRIAEAIVRKSWDMLRNNGQMIFLLRLAFQASISRYYGLWTELPPTEVVVCSRRPSFYGGGTNGTDYALYVWTKTKNGYSMGTERSWVTSLLMYDPDEEEDNG